MKKFVLCMLLACLTLQCGAALAASRGGIVTVEVDLSAHGSGEEAKLWLPYPVSDVNQTVSAVKVSGDFSESGVYTDRENGTSMLYARWDKGTTSRKLVLSSRVERQELLRRDLPATEAAWDPADYRQYLAPTGLGPVDGDVKKLADRITKGKQGIVAKARAIYDWTCENTYRDPDTRGCGTGDVCALLRKPGGKCADISSVYIALCRAAGIPCREVFGIRLGKKATEDITGWQHCWAEFYLPGYGWVPVDPADVRKAMLVEKLKLEDAKTSEYRNYFWGGIDQFRIRLSYGRDLTLNPPQSGAPVNYLMYPFAQVGGKTVDWLDPKSFSYRITYSEK